MSERINNLFTRIYRRYDLMNHIFSLGTDKLWRRHVEIQALSDPGCTDIIDIGAGTGDLSIGIALRAMKKDRKIRIEAVDMNEEMMSLGRNKAAAKKISSIRFARGDALNLQYVEDSFDTMVSSFVLRNLDDFNRFAGEAKRIIKPGGRIILLDMAVPDGPSKHLFIFYFKIMRLIGRLVDKEAYDWLTSSVAAYDKHNAASILEKNGFNDVRISTVFPGVAFIINGVRQ
ncbi:MAG: class I SAM-dependent methyltransferase [Candidatus Marsarchaeota archaeon]|jgi:demethylmenaquinone methyltransferase/2-methoxy-6-polyprenyl-1,4-benzoquinol methylase|nr:class I SAM-dependent methyltransferase [Candidatus Marsarchaeota archaeon]